MLFATVMSGCGTDIEPGSESQPDSSQTDSLQTDSSSLSESQDVETQLPPVIFMKYVSYTNASEEDDSGSSVSFFANDGSHYVSTDGTVCIRTKYRKNLNKVLFQIIDPAIGSDVEASTVIWYGVYYDENGELQYRLIHQTDAMGEHISDNDALNEVYAWLLEHEK